MPFDPFVAALPDEPVEIVVERKRRAAIWKRLTAKYSDGRNVAAKEISNLRIARGVMGVYFDRDNTVSPVEPNGIAVGLLWTEQYKEPPPVGDRFQYSYPITDRPGHRNENEIAAVKAAMRRRLPVFLVDAVTDKVLRQVIPT